VDIQTRLISVCISQNRSLLTLGPIYIKLHITLNQIVPSTDVYNVPVMYVSNSHFTDVSYVP